MLEINPFGENNVMRYLESLEKSILSMVPGLNRYPAETVDAGECYVLRMELPGFDREDLRIRLEEGFLTVSARKCGAEEGCAGAQSYSRSFDMSGVDVDAIEDAHYENGVLTLALPKLPEKQGPAPRDIGIK